jgi:hypothetical protein
LSGRPNAARSSSFAPSSRLRRSWDNPRPPRLMNQLSIDIADWNFVPLVRLLDITDFFRPRAI